MVLVIEIQCRWCKSFFTICRSCFHGQAYCSDVCRVSRRRPAHRKAQRMYRKTNKGKKTHSTAEKRRRKGLTKKNKKTMADRGAIPLPPKGKILLCSDQSSGLTGKTFSRRVVQTGKCYFCGRTGILVGKFPHRGYMAGTNTVGNRGRITTGGKHDKKTYSQP